MDRKVWIIQENPNVNYRPAEEFGELEVVLDSAAGPGYLKKGSPQDWIKSLKRMAADFSPMTDRVVMTGNPIFIAYGLHLIMKKWSKCPVLIWDRRNREYNCLTLEDDDA